MTIPSRSSLVLALCLGLTPLFQAAGAPASGEGFVETRIRPGEAEAGRHWAFKPLSDPKLDELPGTAASHPIDRFILARQEREGVRALGRAGLGTLIRRASFDLTGLPPDLEQLDAFLSDARRDAFERLVDRLLASPRYGERWGRHWLDLVRYADTAGDDSDYPIPQAGLYRDYVIDAFNADKPYDVFIEEQLAGDILARQGPAELYRERVTASGYVAQTKRFGTNKGEDMHLMIEDTLHTTGQVVLGLTLRCARCHDHKYDPTTMEDYYALYGFFRSTRYPHPGSEELRRQEDFVPLVPEEELARLEEVFLAEQGGRIRRLEEQIKGLETAVADKGEREKQSAALKTELEQLQARNPRRTAPRAYAVQEGKPSDAEIQLGGDPHRKDRTVARGVPAFLRAGGALEIPREGSGRLELARWLTHPDNPLTARVMVNRIWQYHFGKGLVSTPSNFGHQGEPPTHPELLDWLARRFIESGWSIKSMHRLIMASDTWQRAGQGGAGPMEQMERDPGNLAYWRFDRRRLDAEALRDTLLLAGGHLNLDRPGPHPFPEEPKWRFTAHHQFKGLYESNHRSVYLMVQRLHPHPYLSLFNGADSTASTAVRDASTLPLQALFMANSPFMHEQAEGLARDLVEGYVDPGDRIQTAYRRLFGRVATAAEMDRAREYLARYAGLAAAEGATAGGETEAWASLARVLLASNEFVYLD